MVHVLLVVVLTASQRKELGPPLGANESGFVKEEAKLSVCFSKKQTQAMCTFWCVAPKLIVG